MTNGADDKDNAHNLTYENETQLNRTVTIPLREYDDLKEQMHYITCLLYTSPSPRDS